VSNVVVCSHTGEKRDAQNQSSQELRGKLCGKGSPAERGLTNVPGESHQHTMVRQEPCMGYKHNVGAVSLPWGTSPGLKGDIVGETDQMVVRLR